MANVTEAESSGAAAQFASVKRSKLAHNWLLWKKKPFGIIGLFLVIFFLVAAGAGNLIAPHGANVFVSEGRLDAPSTRFLFGTDNLGRDVFSRTIYGAQISVAAGVSASGFAIVIGSFFGLIAYFGGWVDQLSQRGLEILNAFPTIVLALIFITILGRTSTTSNQIWVVAWDLRSLEAAIGLSFVYVTTRIIRAAVLKETALPYVEAAKSIGASNTRILYRHILPNVMPIVIVTLSTLIATVILIEASLSFLGYGVAPGVPSWGGDLSTRNRDYFMGSPWLLFAPGISLSLLVIGYNFLGDALRDILDPRLRGSQ